MYLFDHCKLGDLMTYLVFIFTCIIDKDVYSLCSGVRLPTEIINNSIECEQLYRPVNTDFNISKIIRSLMR